MSRKKLNLTRSGERRIKKRTDALLNQAYPVWKAPVVTLRVQPESDPGPQIDYFEETRYTCGIKSRY